MGKGVTRRITYSIRMREFIAVFIILSLVGLKAAGFEKFRASWKWIGLFSIFVFLSLAVHRFLQRLYRDIPAVLYGAAFLDVVGVCGTVALVRYPGNPYVTLFPLAAATWAVLAPGNYVHFVNVLSAGFWFSWKMGMEKVAFFHAFLEGTVILAVMYAVSVGLGQVVRALEKKRKEVVELNKKLSAEKRELKDYADEVLSFTSEVEFKKEMSERARKRYEILFALSKRLRDTDGENIEWITSIFMKTLLEHCESFYMATSWRLRNKISVKEMGKKPEDEHLRSSISRALAGAEEVPLPPEVAIARHTLGDKDHVAIAVLFASPYFADYYSDVVDESCRILAVEIMRLKYTDALKRLTITDDLTGLYNHRYFHQRLEEEKDRCIRMNVPLSLIMLDFDQFKAINDQYGHLFGDRVLKESAARLKTSCRRTDIICRYGGEEFTVILPGTSLEGAVQVAEKIRQAFEKPLEQLTPSVKVTVSLGVSALRAGETSTSELVARADTALLTAKRNGRNRVEVYG